MSIPEKLQLIQKLTGLTQTKLADRLGVSFVAFNSWWTGKTTPRPKAQVQIDELYLEVTGQKIIPLDQLESKKQILVRKSTEHSSVLSEILKNTDIRDEFLLKLTYNSNKIEGSTLTEPDTAAILFDNASLPNKTLSEQLEAKNHQTALLYLFDHLSQKKELDEQLILKLHSILMNGIQSDAGLYRNHAVRILGVNLVVANYVKIPALIHALFVDIRSDKSDILTLATSVHARFEQIHPFSDGNGRIGRILLSAMLLQSDMAPAFIREQSKRLYYTYLYKAQTTNDQSLLENFICDAVIDGFKIVEREDV